MEGQKNNLIIPASILLAGFIIAAGIYFSNKSNNPNPIQNEVQGTIVDIKAVSKADHILGNPDAPVIIVEFSDTECPYCKMFDVTMNTVMDTYGKDGKVAWVYRHFPLDRIHSKSRKEAEATECVNELGGNTAFWKMLDTIYKNTPGNNALDPAQLPIFAKTAGVDVTKFNTCLSSGKYADTVEADFQDGVAAGARGTPYNVMILKNTLSDDAEMTIKSYISQNGLEDNIIISGTKKEIVLSGALPLEIMKTVIDAIIK